MKNLSEYIEEARTLKDLKGKKISKIKVDKVENHDNMIWDSNMIVSIKDINNLSFEDIQQLFDSLIRNSFIQILIGFPPKNYCLEFYTRGKELEAIYYDSAMVYKKKTYIRKMLDDFYDYIMES